MQFIREFTVGGNVYRYSDYKAMAHGERRDLRSALLRALSEEAESRNSRRRVAIDEATRPFRELCDATPQRLGRRSNPAWHTAYDHLLRARAEAALQFDKVNLSASTFAWAGELDRLLWLWETTVETPMEELTRRLETHDWYYSMSDDHRYWTSGSESHRRIRQLVDLLGPEAQLAYNRACPWLNEDGTQLDPAGSP